MDYKMFPHIYNGLMNLTFNKIFFIIIYLLLILDNNRLFINCTTQFDDNKKTCSDVQHIFEGKGIKLTDMPTEPSNDMVLRYCEIPAHGTCCTYSMETRLAGQSRMQLEKNTKDSIGKLASVLGTRAQKFNDIFKNLLADSKKEFHLMFKMTYGVIYEQNAYVFSDLFSELENYYLRGNVELGEAMDSFFNTLYQKMFTVLNTQYQFDDKYLGCVSEHMKELKPFGDVPDKLSVQVKRSFVATRTYAQALSAAADITRNMIAIRPNADCTAALTKMEQCNLCKGFPEKPCSNYCINVMKGCLQHYHEIDQEWDTFVVLMEKVSERLLGPFNIVMVVEPINIKISEAIMNFQETGQDISTQVFQGCGKPILGKKRRSISPRFDFNTDDDDFYIKEDDDTDSLVNNNNNSKEERFKRTAEPGINHELQPYKPLHFSNDDDDEDDDVADDDNKNSNLNSNNENISNNNNNGNSNISGNSNTVNNNNNNNNNNNKGRNNKKNKKNKQQSNAKVHDDTTDTEPELDKLVKDIRQKVKDSKKFWSNLPYQICNNEDLAALPSSDGQCWNGNNVDRYPHAVVTDHQANPEFPTASTSTRQSSIVASQLVALRTAINHLRNAYNGLDVQWSDQEDTSGSGSGSGSGIDDDDDDSGSGLGPFNPSIKFKPDQNNNIHGTDNYRPITDGPILHSPNNNGSKTTSGTSSTTSFGTTTKTGRLPEISIRRALISYLFPIFVAWFGGIFSDLL